MRANFFLLQLEARAAKASSDARQRTAQPRKNLEHPSRFAWTEKFDAIRPNEMESPKEGKPNVSESEPASLVVCVLLP